MKKNIERAGTPAVAVQRIVRPHGWMTISAKIKDGMVTLTASQAAIKVNSYFEPGGFLTICGNASAGTKTLAALQADISFSHQ